jgi:hypothetical protein
MVEILRGSYCPNKSIPRLPGLESPYGLRGHPRLSVGVNGVLVLYSLATWNMTASVKTLVEMSFEHYDRLLAKCPATDREYQILKNGVIAPYGETGKSRRVVVLLCEKSEAKLVLDLARRLYPMATREIREYPSAE